MCMCKELICNEIDFKKISINLIFKFIQINSFTICILNFKRI